MRTGYTFAEVLEFLEDGYKVAREGWNGKGMWVSKTKGRVLDLEQNAIWTLPIMQVAQENGGKVELLPYFNMKTSDNKILIGWTPTASDLLAEDWVVLL